MPCDGDGGGLERKKWRGGGGAAQEMEVIRFRQREGGHDGTTRSKRGWGRRGMREGDG